jgi:hypothetical protein
MPQIEGGFVQHGVFIPFLQINFGAQNKLSYVLNGNNF